MDFENSKIFQIRLTIIYIVLGENNIHKILSIYMFDVKLGYISEIQGFHFILDKNRAGGSWG